MGEAIAERTVSVSVWHVRALTASWPILLLTIASSTSAVDLGPTRTWDTFYGANGSVTITAHDAALSYRAEDITNHPTVLNVVFQPTNYPNLLFKLSEPDNWTAFSGLAIDVHNPEPCEVTLHARIDDAPTATGSDHSMTGVIVIPPGSNLTAIFPFAAPAPMAMGMREPARLPGTVIAKFAPDRSVDLSHIFAIQLFLDHPNQALRLSFDHPRLMQTDLRSLLYSRICDAYGQFTKESWLGKVSTDEDLATAAKTESAALATTSPGELDAFGGQAGPALEATGFFRAHQESNGKWWLVTPSGHLFYSLGVDAIQPNGHGTYIEGREGMFVALPPAGTPLATHYGASDTRTHSSGGQGSGFDHGRYFDFYAANLQRKYGQDFASIWRRSTLDRLRSWGFNTIGNWSEESLATAPDSHGNRMPYVYTPWYGGGFARVGIPHDWRGPLADPFDPRFTESLAKNLRPSLEAHCNDPYLIGYFVDNEPPWAIGRNSAKDQEHYGLLYGVLTQDALSPAKRAWLELLRKQYTSITTLNERWATAFASWDDFLAKPYSVPDTLASVEMRSDFTNFLTRYAEQYFRTIAGVIRRYDKNHLYLGCRFAGFAIEVVEACAKYCDVISINIYAPEVSGGEWAFLDNIQKPAIIGEFHFGATDRGGFGPGLIPVANQAERAESYSRYLRSVLMNPHFVGAHWFSYTDQPLTGRLYDGENYAIGLVSITDTPYPELTVTASQINRAAYSIRQNKNPEPTITAGRSLSK